MIVECLKQQGTLRTATVICWRSIWRWGPVGQRRWKHCLGLVLS